MTGKELFPALRRIGFFPVSDQGVGSFFGVSARTVRGWRLGEDELLPKYVDMVVRMMEHHNIPHTSPALLITHYNYQKKSAQKDYKD